MTEAWVCDAHPCRRVRDDGGMKRQILAVSLLVSGCATASKDPVLSAGTGAADRKMTWNASLDVGVKGEKDVEPAVEKARKIAEDRGGFAASESTNAVVLRVPSAELDAAIEEIEKLGDVQDKWVTGDDVTEGYADLEVRIENAKRFQERLRDLAAKAGSVEELLAVEKEQARVTTELEQLEAQMRLLQSNVSLATIRVSIAKKVTPGPLGWVFYGVYRGVKWLFIWD